MSLYPGQEPLHFWNERNDLGISGSLSLVISEDGNVTRKMNVLPFEAGKLSWSAESPIQSVKEPAKWCPAAAAIFGICGADEGAEFVIRKISLSLSGPRLSHAAEFVLGDEVLFDAPIEASLDGAKDNRLACGAKRFNAAVEVGYVLRPNCVGRTSSQRAPTGLIAVDELLASVLIGLVRPLSQILLGIAYERLAQSGNGDCAVYVGPKPLLIEQVPELFLGNFLVGLALSQDMARAADIGALRAFLLVPPDRRRARHLKDSSRES